MSRLEIEYKHYPSTLDMSQEDRELIARAYEACDSAHAPYSNFHVGAAVLLDNGLIVTGSNQESEVFPSGMCAERTLLYAIQTMGDKAVVKTLAIASNPSNKECYPCGSCRQIILDTQRRQKTPIRIIMAGNGGATVIDNAELLLPFTFTL